MLWHDAAIEIDDVVQCRTKLHICCAHVERVLRDLLKVLATVGCSALLSAAPVTHAGR